MTLIFDTWVELEVGPERTLVLMPEGMHASGPLWVRVDAEHAVRLEQTADVRGAPRGEALYAGFEERIRRGEFCVSSPTPQRVQLYVSRRAQGIEPREPSGKAPPRWVDGQEEDPDPWALLAERREAVREGRVIAMRPPDPAPPAPPRSFFWRPRAT